MQLGAVNKKTRNHSGLLTVLFIFFASRKGKEKNPFLFFFPFHCNNPRLSYKNSHFLYSTLSKKCWDGPPEMDPMRVPWGRGAPCSPTDSHYVALQLGVAQLCSQLGATPGSTGGPFSLSLSASESQKQLQPQHLCLSPLWSEPLSSGEMTEIASIFKSPFERAREQNAAARQQLGIYHRRAGSTPSLTLLLALTLLARFHLFHSTWFFISGGVRHF